MKKLILIAGLLFASALISSCVPSLALIDTTKSSLFDMPKAGIESVASLGDTMVEKYIKTTGEGLRVNEKVYFRDGKLFISKSEAFLTGYLEGKLDQKCYGPFIVFYPSGTLPRDICFSSETNTYVSFLGATASPYLYPRELSPQQNIYVGELLVVDPKNFKQEFIYSGRVGDDLRFIYREFSGDFIRASFTQEVQYDAKEKVIGFKDMKIEIINANNQQITYKLIQNF